MRRPGTAQKLGQSGLARLQQLTNDREYQQRRNKMADQENRNPQQSDPQKPADQKPGNQPNQPVQQMPGGQPKTPQSEQEKRDQDQRERKQA